MGGFCGKAQPVAQVEDEEKNKGRELDRLIKQEDKAEANVNKVLLLGAGESGKSTIFKQIKVLYAVGFNEGELKNYVPVIHANVYQFIKILYDGAIELSTKDDSGKYELSPEVKELGKQFADIGESSEYPVLDKDQGLSVEKIWNDPGIQATYSKANELQLPECIEYFLKNIHRLAQPDYTPTKEDVLHARIRTTGIADMEFKHLQRAYRIFDVGGQRNERRKWIHLFDDVKAVIFCAALSEYDQNLFEDDRKNRMVETMELFEWVLKHPSFQKTAFMVFLNKYDIFKKKVLSVPLSTCEWFRDYQPPATANPDDKIEHAFKYVQSKFEEIYRTTTPGLGASRLYRSYQTTALDPNLMKATFELVDKALLISTVGDLN